MRVFLDATLAASVIALGAGFLGALHPIGDALAVFRPQIALAAGLLSGLHLLLRPRLWACLGLAAAGVGAWSTLPPSETTAAPQARVYSAYQKNLLWSLPDARLVAEDIRAQAPDIQRIG